MKIVNISSKNFEEEVLKSSIPVLVDFNADWCGPCRMLRPILEELSVERKDYKIAAVNIDDERQLAIQYGVFSIPCLVVFKDGKEIKRNVGLIPKDEVEKMMEGFNV